jgi:dihydroneopterin aldolase
MMLKSDVIRIHNAVFYAYHGVASDEQNLGGKFEIDVELRADLSAALESDDLKRTVNYEAVYGMVHAIVTSKKYFLLEALGNTIVKGVMRAWPVVDSVTVRVRKPHPPVKGVVDYVEVEISEKR